VATQSIVEPRYGPWLLERLERGEDPQHALAELTRADEQARYRQVAAVDAQGRIAVHTGDGCIAYAGHATGAQFSAQANMMASDGVWPAMAAAFEAATGPLARRLARALRAAEDAGGDQRGRQSAALLVVGGRTVDVRVDDHPEPLDELDRLLEVDAAYALATEGDNLTGEGRHAEAGAKYEQASALAPDNHELLFWAGLAAAAGGDLATAKAKVERAIAMQPGWDAMLDRLGPDIAPAVERLSLAVRGR
jgi:uncharacterized Ntn-hydrolase superfamily protein